MHRLHARNLGRLSVGLHPEWRRRPHRRPRCLFRLEAPHLELAHREPSHEGANRFRRGRLRAGRPLPPLRRHPQRRQDGRPRRQRGDVGQPRHWRRSLQRHVRLREERRDGQQLGGGRIQLHRRRQVRQVREQPKSRRHRHGPDRLRRGRGDFALPHAFRLDERLLQHL